MEALLRCGCGRWSQPTFLQLCAPCSSLRCQHPSCTAEVAEYGYCTGCGRLHTAFDISRNGPSCPSCRCCGNCGATLPNVKAEQGQPRCSHCGTTAPLRTTAEASASKLAGAISNSKFGQARFLGALEQRLGGKQRRAKVDSEAAAFSIVDTAAAKLSAGIEPASSARVVETKFAELGADDWATGEEDGDDGEPRQQHEEHGLISTAVPLVPLLQRRCLACAAAERPGILMSPNSAPFASIGPAPVHTPGAAPGLTWGKAKWYRKDCSVSHMLPSAELCWSLADATRSSAKPGSGWAAPMPDAARTALQSGQTVTAFIRFTNPADQPVTVQLLGSDSQSIAGVSPGGTQKPQAGLAGLPGQLYGARWCTVDGQRLGDTSDLFPATLQLAGFDPYGLADDDADDDGAVPDGSCGAGSASVKLRHDGSPAHVAVVSVELRCTAAVSTSGASPPVRVQSRFAVMRPQHEAADAETTESDRGPNAASAVPVDVLWAC